jgi:hypothetical protein
VEIGHKKRAKDASLLVDIPRTGRLLRPGAPAACGQRRSTLPHFLAMPPPLWQQDAAFHLRMADRAEEAALHKNITYMESRSDWDDEAEPDPDTEWARYQREGAAKAASKAARAAARAERRQARSEMTPPPPAGGGGWYFKVKHTFCFGQMIQNVIQMIQNEMCVFDKTKCVSG